MSHQKNYEPPMEVLLLTVGEAAQCLSLCRSTTYKLINKKIIPTIRIGRAVRISSQALRQLVAELEAGRLVIPSSREPRPKRRRTK
jgi:excisionase family DNA binding protein